MTSILTSILTSDLFLSCDRPRQIKKKYHFSKEMFKLMTESAKHSQNIVDDKSYKN